MITGRGFNSHKTLTKTLAFFVLGFVFFFNSLIGADLRVLRDPRPSKTPCGLYLASLTDSSLGEKVADLDAKAIEAYIKSHPNLAPKLVYFDRDRGKRITDPNALKKALQTGSAYPVVDRPALFLVGLPLFGEKKSDMFEFVDELLQEQYPDREIPLKTINRPEKPDFSDLQLFKKEAPRFLEKCLEEGCLLVQKALYQLPLPQDYQTPTRGEMKTTAIKLLIANGIRTAAVAMAKKAGVPWHVVWNSAAVDAGNSVGTGVLEKSMSNWFNRSFSGKGRFVKGTALGAFFTADIYWASRKTLEETLKIFSFNGWSTMFKEAGPGLGFNVFWRYFLNQSFYKWEQSMTERGRSEDARRTRNQLGFWSTVFVTPGFVYSVIYPKWFSLTLMGQELLKMNEGHFWMLGAGAIGTLYYFGVPDYNFTTKKWEKASWDHWVERFDRFQAFNKKLGHHLGLTKLLEKIKSITSRTPADPNWAVNGNIKDKIELDKSITSLLEADAEVIKLIHTDPGLKKLIESDNYFSEFKNDLLGPAQALTAP